MNSLMVITEPYYVCFPALGYRVLGKKEIATVAEVLYVINFIKGLANTVLKITINRQVVLVTCGSGYLKHL